MAGQVTIITDFRERRKDLERVTSNFQGRFVGTDSVEPKTLVSAEVPEMSDKHVLMALDLGVHVECANEEGRLVLVSDSPDHLRTVLEALKIKASVYCDGGHEIVEFTGPRVDPADEIRCLRSGMRVGHRPLGNELKR